MRYSLQLVQMRALGIETVSEIKTYKPLLRRSDTLRRREDPVCMEVCESQKNDSAQTGANARYNNRGYYNCSG